jgi:predicted component of type VI protein secretion system
MSYDEALATAEKVLTDGASLPDLLELRDHLRALAHDSVLAARIEDRIARILEREGGGRLDSNDEAV